MHWIIRHIARAVLREIMRTRAYTPPTVTLTLDRAEAYHVYTALKRELGYTPMLPHVEWHTVAEIVQRLEAAMEVLE